ncbi:MAG: DHH family phosphoesterase [candidate division WOR-3 bacterium]|nr:DHH family phosphoesterase [candidate division WOR-3 bacterium]MCR4423769.1 DHH family phosphoesterase [candidate division WOR-3 bacterium]MDH7519108.1 DHH family phosphoesterase [bacterium]
MVSSTVWPVKPVDEERVKALIQELRVSEPLARLLVLRGVEDRTDAERWLNPNFTHLHPPDLLPDFELARDRIFQAIEKKETVLIWGHDDLDGITATVLLYQVLSGLQAKVRYYIPVKGKDKHGLDYRYIEGDGANEVRLIITVDCGITNYQDVAELKRVGVDVVVTDHHEVIDPLPGAVATVDPKRLDSDYPDTNLTGVGVALKLALGLVQEKLGFSTAEFFSVYQDALVLATLGTIADRASLIGENRVLVKHGLRLLEKTSIPAVRAVLKSINFPPQGFTVNGFLAELLPLFAAANGADGVRHFLNQDPAVAEEWVKELVVRSQMWREEAEKTFTLASANVRLGDGILFVQHPDLSLRALGFSAARLRERYGVPAIVIGRRGDVWVGECRGMDGVDLMELLRALRNYFIDYGGHKKAAGFSIKEENVADFIRAAERFAHTNFAPKIVRESMPFADGLLPLSKFERDVIELAPFGEGNPQPIFVSEPTAFTFSEKGFVPETNPALVLLPGRGDCQITPGVMYRVLYTVDDLGQIAIIACHSESESAH